MSRPLRPGILSVVQTPFTEEGTLDTASLGRLVRDAVAAGADGLLAPVEASEVRDLDEETRERIARVVHEALRGDLPWILGASPPTDPHPDWDVAKNTALEACIHHAGLANEFGAAAYLVAIPWQLYAQQDRVLPFLKAVAAATPTPLVVQDLQFGGPGLDLETIRDLRPGLRGKLLGIKIETVPAGPKYTAVREALGDDVFVAGGWAVPQMIEALDRGVDAMIPESSMVRVYKAIDRAYRGGDRARAVALHRRLVPVLAFANQELYASVAFFKRLLKRKGVFASDRLAPRRDELGRPLPPRFEWDRYNERIADELIDLYLELEREQAG